MLGAALIAASGVALAGHEAQRWRLSATGQFAWAVLAIAVGFVGALSSAVGQVRTRQSERLREQIRGILAPLAFELQDLTVIDVRELGLAVYQRRRWGWWRWPWEQRLYRLHRERPRRAAVSGIAWRPGVGVIGRCVDRGQDVWEDLAFLDDQLGQVGAGDWAALGPDVTYGLSFADYQRVRGKFGVVLATPLVREAPTGAQVVGCISVDAPGGTVQQLASDEARSAVAAAADLLMASVLR
jgi:hypothetical protein